MRLQLERRGTEPKRQTTFTFRQIEENGKIRFVYACNTAENHSQAYKKRDPMTLKQR